MRGCMATALTRGAVAIVTAVKTNVCAQNVTNCILGNPYILLFNTDILASDHLLVLLLNVTPWSGQAPLFCLVVAET